MIKRKNMLIIDFEWLMQEVETYTQRDQRIAKQTISFALAILDKCSLSNRDEYDNKFVYMQELQNNIPINITLQMWVGYVKLKMTERFWYLYDSGNVDFYTSLLVNKNNWSETNTLDYDIIEIFQKDLHTFNQREQNIVEYTINFFTEIMDLTEVQDSEEYSLILAYLSELHNKQGKDSNLKIILKHFIQKIKQVPASKCKHQKECTHKIPIDNWIFSPIERKRDQLGYKREKIMRQDVQNHSGYYRIVGNYFEDRLYSHFQLHRGEKLPNLENVDGIISLLYPAESRVKMKRDETDKYYMMTLLDDVFTQEEVSELLKISYKEFMNTSIQPILKQGLSSFMSSTCHCGFKRKHGGSSMGTYVDDRFEYSISFTIEPPK